MSNVINWINENPLIAVFIIQLASLIFGAIKFAIEWKYERHTIKCTECVIRSRSNNGSNDGNR